MKKKLNKFMEIFWLSLGIVALLMAFYMIATKGWGNAFHFLIFPLLAGAMYGLRRRMGKEGRKES
ncbi:MAG: hypothetical protein ABEH38_00190 [Flavobacteriales bacterium]